jgi:tetratricopeptide (TPR) repeat protein
MTDSTLKYQPQIDKSILGAIGDYSQVIQNIHLEPGQPSPYMLPQKIQDFTGRVDYIAKIEEILARGKIAAIAGIPGVGKSALAIRVAHQLKDRYPDAQLYVNLHGQTPESALETKTVLIRFLTALTGRDESQLATDLDGLVAQYRSTLADKRALIILDNARDEAQIRDLLPSSPDCGVVVTSRSRLTGLPGAGSIALEPMAVGIESELGDAELLFQAILQDGKRVEAELPAAREIVSLCGGLPIAIRITAATLKQQIWARKSLQAYAQELDTELRLDKLENEHVEAAIPGQGSVRASFNLSYQTLTEEEQQLFRYAGGLPGVNFGLEILAAVMDREESQIETGLGRLLEAQVLESRGDDRFGWHDLMRLFAKAQLTDTERETVSDRGLTWYCEQADFWENGLNPLCCRQMAQQQAAATENSAEDLERMLPMRAIDWFTTEQNNWVDVVRDLIQIPRPDDAIALAANLTPFFRRCSCWDDWVTTHQMTKDCAQQSGNLAGVALTLGNLGIVYRSQSKWGQAIDCYEQSLDIFRRLRNEHYVAKTLCNLGVVYQSQSKWDGAIACCEESLEISRRLGDELGVAQNLDNLGIVYRKQSKWDQAIDCHEKSLEISRRLGDELGVAQILNNLGNVYHSQRKWKQAINCFEQSLETKRRLGNKPGVAQTLGNLGNVYQSQSKWDGAIACYEQSLEISCQLGDEYCVAQILNNLGGVYQNQGKWDQAIFCYEKSLETKRRLGDEHGVGQTLVNLGVLHDRRNQPEQARTLWQEALISLNPSSSEFQTVQQWLETPPKPRWVNYLLPLAVGGLILLCLVKGYWLLAIFGIATILFCFRRSIFRRNYDLSD